MARTTRGSVAIVTGSARNIGRAIALELAASGVAVLVNAKTSQNALDEVVNTIAVAGGRAAAHLADVGNPQAATDLTAAAIREFGKLDILINNAAIRRQSRFETLT